VLQGVAIDDLVDTARLGDGSGRLNMAVTDMRRTPIISARNSCVKDTVSLSAQSGDCSNQRQNLARVVQYLQETVTRACDSRTAL
jgi:hypothetical protein